MMRLDRRRLLAGSCALMVAGRAARAADSRDHAVFWKVAPPGAAPSILFGYDAVAAAAAPNLLATGERLAEPTRHLIIDIPTARFAPRRINTNDVPPLAQRYGAAATQKILDVLRIVAPQWPKPDILPGFMIALLVLSEGRTPNGAGDSLPTTLFTRIFQTGEATSYLFPFDEMVRKNLVPNPSEGGHDSILYLLDLRAKLGPLGRHAESLYVQERLVDLWRFHLDLQRHGLSMMPNQDAWADLLVERAVAAIQAARKPTFLMMPSGNFVRDDGILARLERAGVSVVPAG